MWAAVAPGRVVYEPIQTPSQVWLTTAGALAFALAKANGTREARLEAAAPLAGPAAGPVDVGETGQVGYFALEDGALVAVDLPGGTLTNALTYLSMGNVPLSIALTAVATLLAILTIPIVIEFLAGAAIGSQGHAVASQIELAMGAVGGPSGLGDERPGGVVGAGDPDGAAGEPVRAQRLD